MDRPHRGWRGCLIRLKYLGPKKTGLKLCLRCFAGHRRRFAVTHNTTSAFNCLSALDQMLSVFDEFVRIRGANPRDFGSHHAMRKYQPAPFDRRVIQPSSSTAESNFSVASRII